MKWTDENNKLLVETVKKCKDCTNKINWNLVQQYLPQFEKTKLKSQYTNKLKNDVTYTKWTINERILLSFCVSVYQTNWSFIQKNYFLKRNKQQLRSQFHQNMKMRQIGWQMMDDIINDNFDLNLYSLIQIKDIIKFYTTIKNRIYLRENKPIQEPTQLDQMLGLKYNDPIELNIIQDITQRYNLNILEQTIEKLKQIQQLKTLQQ